MTIQEAREEVAKDNGRDNWAHIRFSEDLSQDAKETLLWMAAQRYAKAKWDEACEAQKQLCVDTWKAGFIPQQSPYPEFKP